MRPLRLALLSLSGMGGSVRMATELGARMAARGHSVRLLSQRRPPGLEDGERLAWVEVPVVPAPPLSDPPLTLAFASTLADLPDVDLVHAHYAVPHATAAFLAKEYAELEGRRLPYIVSLHGTDVTRLGPMASFRGTTKLALARSAAVTAPSRFLQREAAEWFGLAPGAVQLIPNCVDADRFTAKGRRAGGGPLRLVHVSNLRPIKRVQDALQAVARCGRDVRLTIVGDGPERGGLEGLARELGIEDRVDFPGSSSRVAERLHAADAFIFPSQTESFGLAAIEASSCGLPVLASNVGGLPEVVLEGETGLLHPVGDVDALAANIRRLADEPELAARLGEAGCRHAARFSPAVTVDAFERLYAKTIEQGAEEGLLGYRP